MGQSLTSSKNQSISSFDAYYKTSFANLDKISSPTQIQKLDQNSELVKAFTLLKNQQYENAIRLIDNLIQRFPNLADAQYLKGLAYLGLNNLKQALYFCQKATQLDKKHSKAMAEIGNIYVLNKKYQEAFDVFNKLIEMNEKSFEGYFGMAFVSAILKNFEGAQIYYERALQIKENDKGALLNYGHLQVKQQNYESALELYMKALQADSNYLEAIQSICNLFMIQKNYQILHQFCDQHLESEFPLIKIGLLNYKSQAYFSQKQFDKSISLCKEVLILDCKNFEALFGIAMSLFNLNQLQHSLDYFEKVLEEYPQEIRALKMIVKVYSTLQQYNQQREYCDQLIQIDKKDYSAYFFRGISFMQQQNYQSAIDDFNIVISNDQSNFMAIKHKGFCLSMLKMYNQAIKCYDQIIKYILDIKEKQVLFFEKGFCHLKLQQNLSAKQVFDEAIELDINNQELKLKIANLARDNKIVDYAYRLYDELICENEKIPIYYIEKASMCEKYQDYIKAKELYDKVINLCDKNFEFYLKRSKILIQLQLFNEAIEDLYQGIKLDDQQSELYYEFGQILLYKQNFNEARTMFQKACVLKENVEKYHIKYAITLKMLKAESEAIQHLVGVLKNYPDFEDCRDVLDSLSSQYQYTQEYIKVFSYISISFMQEGVLDQNQNKEEIQNYIQETLETELKTKIPKINNIFEIICQLMKNLYQIDNQKEFQMIICKIFKNNFNNVEQFIKQIIQISKRMASLQTYNFKQEKGITVGQIQKEIDKLGQSYQILNQFKNKVASTAISDCLGLLTTLIINSNEIEHNLNNKIEIMIESDRLNQYS